MSRQLEQEREVRKAARNTAVIKALEYGIVGALESQGIDLVGFSFKYDAFNCLMTIKARFAEDRQVAFVGSESIIGCILKSQSDARNDRLVWRPDRYHTSKD